LRNVPAFIAAWDSGGDGRARWRYRLRRSFVGNINTKGQIGGLSAPALPHWHPQFGPAIEEGVRALVLALIRGGETISYTSCTGHDYRPLPLENVERHVGLLPRNACERDRLVDRLTRVIALARPCLRGVAAYPGLLSTSLQDRDRLWPTVDLYIARQSNGSWSDYFNELDAATRHVVEAVDAVFAGISARRSAYEHS
jgi:uncharacterized protein